MTKTAKSNIHYAWIVLAAACVLSIAARADHGSFGVFVEPLVELYSWTAVASRNELASDAVLAFKTRLASPPNGGQTVAVRFVRRDDMVAAK